jgi:hypothetical protein
VKSFLLAIAASLAIIGPASAATCTSTSNFGTISAPGLTVFGNSFGSVQHFSDCYTFTLSGPSSVSGLSWEFDLSWVRGIDLTSVSLSGASLPSTLMDTSPGSFSFGNLIAAGYPAPSAMGDCSRRCRRPRLSPARSSVLGFQDCCWRSGD